MQIDAYADSDATTSAPHTKSKAVLRRNIQITKLFKLLAACVYVSSTLNEKMESL